MDAYQQLQRKFADFNELLGQTVQRLGDRAEEQEAVDRDLSARCQDAQLWEERESRIRCLESVNDQMRHEIETLRSEATSLHEDTEAMQKKFLEDQKRRAPEVVIQSYDHSQSKPDTVTYKAYSDLARFYADLYKERGALIESYSVLATKLKRCKTKFREWDRYFERDMIDVVVNGKRVVFKRVDDVQPISTTPRPVGKHHGDESPNLPEIRQRRQRQSAPDVTPTRRRSDEDPSSTQSQDPRWPIEETFQPSEGSSDTPTVVAAKSLSKRSSKNQIPRTSGHGPHDRQPGNSAQPITVKSEHSSNPDIRMASLATHPSDRPEEALSEPLPPGLGHNAHLQGAEFPILQDPTHPDNNEPPSHREGSQRNTPPSPTTTKRPALQPLDSNSTAQRNNLREAKRRKFEPRGAAAIPSVAEDGEEQSGRREKAASKAPKGRVANAPTGASTGGRLLKLLGEPAGPKPVLSPSPKTGSANNSPRVQSPRLGESAKTPVARPDRTALGEVTTTPTPRSASNCHGHVATPPTGDNADGVSPESEPYRARPVNRLGLQHFKVNPERNQGLDFPFQEVVRNKAERKCLSGCVRQDCCGPIFRSMAVEGCLGRPKIPESVSFENLDQEDRLCLEKYLGYTIDTLASMPNSELRPLLIDVRARDLADQYGRHRYAHERARTPPGFWRTDMPNTQQEERDRKLASEMDRVKVMERYREAMRPGGLWLFADE